MSVPDEKPVTAVSPEIDPPDSPLQAFSRGIALKCPLCCRGSLFSGWFRMHPHCTVCGLRFERDPGYFLGSTYINYGLTTLITTWTYIVLRFGANLDKTWLIPSLAGFCVIFPLVFFRYARSLWLSFDCYFDRAGALESRSESGDFLDSNSSQKN
jgi:uncharacterized protein (DUF983 family)